MTDKKSVYVISIDPGINNTGFAVLEIDPATMKTLSVPVLRLFTVAAETTKKKMESVDLGRTKSKSKKVRGDVFKMEKVYYRAKIIFDKMIAEIQQVIPKYNPVCLFSERPQNGGLRRSNDSYVSSGASMAMLACLPMKVTFVSSMEVKEAGAGLNTDKDAMIAHYVERFPDAEWKRAGKEKRLTKDNEHPADAIAVGEAGVLMPEVQKMLRAEFEKPIVEEVA